MATVSIRLRSLLPRWMLATDPYVRVNGGSPSRLTKTPLELQVPPGPLQVEVALLRSDHSAAKGFWGNPVVRHLSPNNTVSRYDGDVLESDRLRLSFRPARFASIWFPGHLRRE